MGAVYGGCSCLHATPTSTRPGKIRLTAALLLLAAPLAVAARGRGGVCGPAGAEQRRRPFLDVSALGLRRLPAIGALVSDADSAATSLANKPRVQHELLHGPSLSRPHLAYPPEHGASEGRAEALAPSASGRGRGSQGRLPLEGTHGRPGRRLPASRPQSRGMADPVCQPRQSARRVRAGPAPREPRHFDANAEGRHPVRSAQARRHPGRSHPRRPDGLRGSRPRGPQYQARRAQAQLRHRLEGGAPRAGASWASASRSSRRCSHSPTRCRPRSRGAGCRGRSGSGPSACSRTSATVSSSSIATASIRLWNPAAEAITGLRSDAISDRPAAEAIPGWPTIAARVPVARRPGEFEDDVERRDRAAGGRRAGDLALDRRRHASPTASCTRSAT